MRHRAARPLVGVAQTFTQRGGEFRSPAVQMGIRSKKVIGCDAQPEHAVGRARAVRQPIEKREVGGGEVRSQNALRYKEDTSDNYDDRR